MSLDPSDIKNYHPVSNLSFLSKVLERIVLSQLNERLNHNNLVRPLQSAYRPNHSTEIVLCRIINNLLTAMDNKKIDILTHLDLSAAFDTTDHQILLTQLHHSFGISGSALSWFLFHLSNRIHAITINSLQSQHTMLCHGIPQGSVLGPVLSILYTQPLFDIVSKHAVNQHAFTDDDQLNMISALTELPERTHTPNHTHKRIACTWITSVDTPHPHPAHLEKNIKNNNNNGQPGARDSFSVNRLNESESEILLSLWACRLIQSSQISVRMKSMSACSPYVRFGGYAELCG